MGEIIQFTEEQFEILEDISKSNNEKAERFVHKLAENCGYKDANEMYIKEMEVLKDKLKKYWDIKWYSPEVIKELRQINNEFEKIVWIKKDNSSLYLLNEIRGKWENLYLK